MTSRKFRIRYNLVIFIAASMIADVICYMVYSYYALTEYNQNAAPFWYFLYLANFQVYHWTLSFTYFRCSWELRYIANRKEVPKRTRLINRMFFWTVLVVGCIAAIWPFFFKDSEKNVFVGIQSIYLFFAFISAIFMVIVLCKIRSFLKQRGLGNEWVL